MPLRPFLRPSLAALCAGLLLAACGGGGGGGDNTATPPVTASNGPGSSTPAPAPTTTPGSTGFAAGAPQALALQRLNDARTQCGFGALQEAAELDASAQAHANYMAANGAYGHEEVQGKPGFTGVAFSDRETAAGYRWSFAGETLDQVANGSTGADAIRQLLAAPYHAALMLNGFRDVGLGWSTVNGFGTLTADFGTRQGQSNGAVAGVVTYPCNGIADAVPVANAESPSPFPSNPSATWGQPIIVRGPADLALTGASITGPSGSVQIQAIYGSGQQADPNSTGDFSNGFFGIIPAPLQPATTYTVTVAYTSGGVAGRTSFSFATASR